MKYALEYTPPAPALTVELARPFSSQSRESRAKLDSGADMTVLPQPLIGELRLVPASRIAVYSFNEREEERYTYFVDISFHSFVFPLVEVIGARRRDVLLGRDVLNLLKTTLDGKALNFELVDP